jgi:hypothetical protein
MAERPSIEAAGDRETVEASFLQQTPEVGRIRFDEPSYERRSRIASRNR